MNDKKNHIEKYHASAKKCVNLDSVNTIKLLARKKVDVYQTAGLTNKPLITDSSVIVLTSRGDLIAYDLDIKNKLWSVSLNAKNRILSSAGKMVEEHGILYVTYGANKLAAIDIKNGHQVWIQNFDDLVKGKPIIQDDKIFLHSAHNKIYALKKSDGKVIWRHEDSDYPTITFADFSPVTYKGDIFFQIANNEIISLDQNTGVINKMISINDQYGFKNTEIQKDIPNHFFIDNNIIYCTSKDGKLSAIDYDTKLEIWNRQINSSTKFFIYQEAIYTITNKDELAAINKKTGEIIYIVNLNTCLKTKNNYHKWTKPVIYENSVLVTSYDGNLLSFDIKSGNLLVHGGEVGLVTSSPSIYKDYIYLIANNGNLYKYSK